MRRGQATPPPRLARLPPALAPDSVLYVALAATAVAVAGHVLPFAISIAAAIDSAAASKSGSANLSGKFACHFVSVNDNDS